MNYTYFILLIFFLTSTLSFGQADTENADSNMESKYDFSYEDLDTLTKVYLNYYYTEDERATILEDKRKLIGINYLCTESFEIINNPEDFTLEQYLSIKIEKLSSKRLVEESVEIYDEDSGLMLRLYSHSTVKKKLGVYSNHNQRINNN
ncbi:MAG: hypothetical protein COA32_04730 [Fluviicola sp.]|nr:MAG: hypothetical protein COA32_04730 [Fluviicola sp.]